MAAIAAPTYDNMQINLVEENNTIVITIDHIGY